MNIIHPIKALRLPVKVDGVGLPLVLVPGGLTGWQSWVPFTDIFTGQHRKVVRIQLLSVEYGLEDKELPTDYSVRTESQALASTIDSLALDTPVDIVAWSYGALVSIDYALDHPEQIRALTLIEPPAIWVLRDEGKIDEETRNTLDLLSSLKGDITDDMLAGFLQSVGLTKPGESPKSVPQWEQWLPFRRSLRNSPAVVAHMDDLLRLKDLKIPVLLVKGTGSAPFLHKIIDGLASNLPNAKVIEMPGGHAPHIVSRETFLMELQKFQNLL